MSAETHVRILRTSRDEIADIATLTGHRTADVVAALLDLAREQPERIAELLADRPKVANTHGPDGKFTKVSPAP